MNTFTLAFFKSTLRTHLKQNLEFLFVIYLLTDTFFCKTKFRNSFAGQKQLSDRLYPICWYFDRHPIYEGHSLFCSLVFQQHLQPLCLLQLFWRNPPQPVHIWPSSQTSFLWQPTTLTGVCPKWRPQRMLGHLRHSETAFPSAAFWRKGTKLVTVG